MDATLKPCPVCGSQAELKEAHYLESERPYSYVHCTNEAYTLDHKAPHISNSTEAKKDLDAITAWNQRLETPALHH
jgi:rRNA maturation protein Nop10